VSSGYSKPYGTVVSVERRAVKQEFWDIQVLDTNNYVTKDGCVHHNSGKTTGIFMKLVYMASLQAPSPDGIRRTRAVVVRNTMPQLKDTTLVSWGYWFKDNQAGTWNATDKIFTLRFADVECIVMFRPLDTPDDVNRVLSLEINFALVDEFVEIPKPIIDALSGRLGRYKQPDGTPVTIWGMWGSSNPSTEDNWWFDYLHNDAVLKFSFDDDDMLQQKMRRALKYGTSDDMNVTYFHQPSAWDDAVENLENLPGHKGYYTNLAKGKSDVWVKQFVEAQWGFSVFGQPVVAQFSENNHVARKPYLFNPHLRLIIPFDPGLTGSAFLFMQEDYDGRLIVFKELVQEGMGAKRLIEDRLMPTLNKDFRGADFIIVPDPAAANRTQTDEKSVLKMFQDAFGRDRVDCESNNRFPLRLNAIDYYTSKLMGDVGALQINKDGCPILIRALKGGWRYAADTKKDILKGVMPEKNPFSHVGDTFGYGCRYYHRGILRNEKYGMKATAYGTGANRGVGKRYISPNYHAR
jgi:hypothetical protein